jgi:hypothetical protein
MVYVPVEWVGKKVKVILIEPTDADTDKSDDNYI